MGNVNYFILLPSFLSCRERITLETRENHLLSEFEWITFKAHKMTGRKTTSLFSLLFSFGQCQLVPVERSVVFALLFMTFARN